MKKLLMTALLLLSACEAPVDEEGAPLGGVPDAAASCSTAEPPEGPVHFAGQDVYPSECGVPGSCAAPICWHCADGPGGITWEIFANDCPRADAGPARW